MLRHLPAFMDQETLYSVIARFGGRLGVGEAGPFMAALLGRRHAIASPDLPGGLDALVSDLDPDRRSGAVAAIVEGATLFPFHTSFVPAGLRAEVRSAMLGDMTGVHLRLGLATFRVRPPARLRFCPVCLDRMEAARGDLWWRRDHQLPGIPVCAEHGDPLLLSAVDAGGLNRHSFVPASRTVCPADAEPAVVAGRDDLARLRVLARSALALLHAPPPARSFAEIADGYRERLAEVGVMRSARRVDHAALRRAFAAHWGGVPGLLGLDLGDDVEGSWLAGMVRSGRRAAHPVQHLLLRGMLDALADVPRHLPFGAGPWPCRNPVAEHHGALVVTDVALRRDREMLYGDFACGCGYLHTRSFAPDGTVGEPRYRRFGPLLEPALRAAIGRGDGLRATARRLGLDPKTLVREAAMAGVVVPWTLTPSGAVRVATTPPSAPTSSRPARSAGPVRPRRNWFAIDTRMSRSVRRAAASLLASVPPVRVTMASIEAMVARREWVGKRRAKLPQTMAAIADAVEDVDAFRLRRMRHQVGLALAKGDLRPCEVLRAAGLPTDWLDAVRDEIGLALRRRREAA